MLPPSLMYFLAPSLTLHPDVCMKGKSLVVSYAFCRFSEFLRQRNCKRTDWYVARVLLEILAQFERQQHWWEVVALHLLLIEEADTLNILPVGKNRERPKKLQY